MNRQDKLNSLLPSAHDLSDEEISKGVNGLLSSPNHSYGTNQENGDVESAELLHSSILIENTRQSESLGLLLMLASAAGFSLNGLTVKLSGHYFPAPLIVLSRSIFQASFGILACLILRIPPLGPSFKRRLLIERGIYGAIGLALYYYSLTVLPIADATVLFFTGPVFTSIFAYLWLGESFTFFDKCASVICLIGVIFTAKPPFIFGNLDFFQDPTIPSSKEILGAAAAVTGAVLSACAYVTVRKIGSDVHFLNHVVSFGLASTVFSGFMIALDSGNIRNTLSDNLGFNYQTSLLLLVGTTAVVGQCLLNRGLQLCRAGPATLMRNVDVVFAYIYGIFIFNEIPSLISLFGALLIITCTLSMGLKKWLFRS